MIKEVKKLVKKIHKDEKGQTFIEMAFVILLVILALYPSIKSFATDGIQPKYDQMKTQLQAVSVPSLQ